MTQRDRDQPAGLRTPLPVTGSLTELQRPKTFTQFLESERGGSEREDEREVFFWFFWFFVFFVFLKARLRTVGLLLHQSFEDSLLLLLLLLPLLDNLVRGLEMTISSLCVQTVESWAR